MPAPRRPVPASARVSPLRRLRRALPALGLAAAAVLALSIPARAKDWSHIRVATEGAYPPFNMHAPDGSLIGFEPELLADLCPRMHATCELMAQDWNGAIPALLAGKFDAIMSGMAITPKRLEVIAFSVPYTNSPTTFGVLKAGDPATLPGTGTRVSLTDDAARTRAIAELTPVLKGKTVGVQVSTIQADFLTTYFKGIAALRTYPTTLEEDMDLKSGRVDLTLASAANLVGSIDRSQGAMQMAGPSFSGGLLGIGSGFGLRKEDTDLKAMFDAAIRAAIADGTVRRLALKWFKFDTTPVAS